MARRRHKENRGLPARWRHYHAAYYYQVPPGLESQWDGKKQFRLGATLGEAATEWAKRMNVAERPVTYVRGLLDRYAGEVVPTKAVATRAGDYASLVSLRKVFGDMRLVRCRAATHLQVRGYACKPLGEEVPLDSTSRRRRSQTRIRQGCRVGIDRKASLQGRSAPERRETSHSLR